MASFVDLERLQNEKQMSHPHAQQLKTSYLSPSLTPQGPQRPMNDNMLGTNVGISHSGNVDSRNPNTNSHRRNPSRTDVFANSFIQGKKVDSPKIFLGNKVGDDRPKTSAQHTRKLKNKESKETKKKANHIRKNATALNASQVVAPSQILQGKINMGGLHTNKEADSRKFDFGFPPHHSKVSSNQTSASLGKKKNSIARTQNSKMTRHQRNYTTTQQELKNTKINNFFSEDQSVAQGDGSTIEFEPVSAGGSASIITKNTNQQQFNTNSKSSKTVREKDGYTKVRNSQQNPSTNGSSAYQSQTNSNYQQQRKRQLSAKMPKTLLNVSYSTGAKPQVSLNTTQHMSVKKRTSIGHPQTTKSMMTKPPIGSTLAQKKKSAQMHPSENKTDVSRTYKSNTGGSHHTRTKSIDRTSTAHSTGQVKQMSTKNKTKGGTQTERGKRGNFHSQLKTTTASVNTSIAYKNLSAHLLEQANPVQAATVGNDSAIRQSMPNMQDNNKENLQLPTNAIQASRTMRIANLSGEDGDFSISSMSADSSHRANKSTLNKTNSGNNPLGKIFGKNYFVDGEQLLRHISPCQPRSPGESVVADNQQVNLLNVTDLHAKDGPSHLRLTQQLSGKRSKTTRGQRPQTSKQLHSGRPKLSVIPGTETLESEINLGSNILSGKTNKSQLDGLMRGVALSVSGDQRQERSQERERSKSKGRQQQQNGVSQSYSNIQANSQNKNSKNTKVDKLIQKNIKKKGKQNMEEMLKKFMEENQKKKRQMNLMQMNQEIKIKNAKGHVDREVGHSMMKPSADEKKHRSRSCIQQNRDNFFVHHSGVVSPTLKQYQNPSSREKGDKNRYQDPNKTAILSNGGNNLDKKRHPARDKNCVIELSMLKKEVDDEIRRDRKKLIKNPQQQRQVGKPELMLSNHSVNMSAIINKSSSQKEKSQARTSTALHQRVDSKRANGTNSTQTAINYTSLRRKDPELLLDQQNLTDGNIKAKVRKVIEHGKIEYAGLNHNGINTTKIQKYIDKQKKRNALKVRNQKTIEHEKILRVHENLTKLHNFTVSNRMRQPLPTSNTNKEQINIQYKHPPSATNAKRTPNNAFEQVKSIKKHRDNSSRRRSNERFGGGQQARTGMSAERESELLQNSGYQGSKRRQSRFGSTESRRKSSGNRYQEPGETLQRDEPSIINVYDRQTRAGSSPHTRKLSNNSRSRYSESQATSPQTRPLTGSAAAPLRQLKPKLASSGKQKRQQQQEDYQRLRIHEADQNNNYSNTHGLYQSLDAENAHHRAQNVGDQTETYKQFESLEHSRQADTNSYQAAQQNQMTSTFVGENSIVQETNKSPPLRKVVRKMIDKYGYEDESDSLAVFRLNYAASFIKRRMKNYLNFRQNQTYQQMQQSKFDQDMQQLVKQQQEKMRQEKLQRELYEQEMLQQQQQMQLQSESEQTPSRYAKDDDIDRSSSYSVVDNQVQNVVEKRKRVPQIQLGATDDSIQLEAINSKIRQDDQAMIQEQEQISSERKSREQTGQSQRLNIPQLQLHKVQSHDDQQKNKKLLNVPPKSGPFNSAYSNRSHRDESSRSIFEDRKTFRQFMGPGKLAPQDFDPEEYPKMLKIREEAIAYREKTTKKQINKEYKQNKISPRTFKRKNSELEKWVTKEKEEVKKTEIKFEEEWQKTARMVENTHQNYEQIRRILQTKDNQYDNAMISSSSRMHHKGSSHNVNDVLVTDGAQPQTSQTNQGVLAMINERDQKIKQSSMDSKKSSQQRHSILDMVGADTDLIIDSESAEADSARKRRSGNSATSGKQGIGLMINNFTPGQSSGSDQFRHKHHVGSLNQAANSSQKSSERQSRGQGSQEASDDNQDMLDQISVQNPQQNMLMKDLRQLKINQNSEDTGSFQNDDKTPKEMQWMSSGGGDAKKITSPADTNASYIDKSNTRQFNDLQVTPSISQNTGSQPQVDQFESRKNSIDFKGGDRKNSFNAINTRKIDTNSSYKSGDSAPEPPHHHVPAEVVNSLARVTSYNKLDRQDEDDSASDKFEEINKMHRAQEETKNQDLKPTYDVIQLDQDDRNLATKLMDAGSPNSIQSHPNVLNQREDIKGNMKQNNFFMTNSNSQNDLKNEQNVVYQLKNLDTQPLASPTMPQTTPLSTDSGTQKIRMENAGEPVDQIQTDTNIYQGDPQLLQSPVSLDSANQGIFSGGKSLSSSTSKDNQPPMSHLPTDPTMLNSSGPNITFEGIQPQDTSLCKISVHDSKDEIDPLNAGQVNIFTNTDKPSPLDSNLDQEKAIKLTGPNPDGNIRDVLDDVVRSERQTMPGQNLSPQLQAEGENYVNELLEYLLQDMSNEGLDHLINRSARRQQEVRAELRARCTGIKTDLFAIERYVDEIHQRITADPEGFFRTLYKPLTREGLVVLNQLQNSEIGSCEHFDETYPMVLPLKLYLTLEKKRKAKKEEDAKQAREKEAADKGMSVEELKKDLPQNFDAECEHIHNKVLFDCINDSLLQFKPFGKDGEPLPWSRQSRRLKPTDDFNLNEIFEIVKHDLFRWAINLAGTLPRREFIYQGEFDEELFSEIREKKLVQLLAREMIETEPKWLNYEFEQAQVKIDVGDMILEQLVNETISILNEQAQRDFSNDEAH